MEKRTPHCKLSVIKAMIQDGQVRITLSALTGGAALGFAAEAIIGVVMGLTTKDFYKSMTTHTDLGFGRCIPDNDVSRRGVSETDRHR